MIWEALVATVSAMVGAGFASGREIQVFFSSHGRAAVPLGLLAMGLLMFAAARAAHLGESLAGLTRRLFGRMRPAAQAFLYAANWLTLSAVLAVLGSLGRSATGLPASIWSLFAAAAAALVVGAGGTRQRAIQGLLLLVVLCAAVPVTLFGSWLNLVALRPIMPSVPAAAGVFGFCAYNVTLAVDGIAAVRGASRERRVGAAMGGLTVGILLTLEAIALASAPATVRLAELPLVALAGSHHGALGGLLGIAIALAGVSAAASFTSAVAPAVRSPGLAALTGYIGSLLGVGTLIDRGYPIMAGLAAIWLVRLLTARPARKSN